MVNDDVNRRHRVEKEAAELGGLVSWTDTSGAFPFTLPAAIDWPAFWATDDLDDDEWLAEPCIARGRGHSMYADAKTGKSLFALNVAAAVATGAAILDRPAGIAEDVVYLDYEMTERDLRERLTDMGYGPTRDLGRLHYYQLPAMAPLDTENGGIILEHLAEEHGAALVVIDTMARATTGEENDADTIRDFYRFAGARLKRAGVAYWRLDNSGKDLLKGARGSSAKNDDVDIVWRATATSDGLELRATHKRMGWVPERFSVARDTEPLTHRRTDAGWPPGTGELARLLDQLAVPPTAPVRAAQMVLREAGEGRSSLLTTAAQRWRRTQLPAPETRSETRIPTARETEPENAL